MVLSSTVAVARTGTKSLRVTVPEGIVAFLGLEVGDKLEWVMEIINGKRVAIALKATAAENVDESDKASKALGMTKDELLEFLMEKGFQPSNELKAAIDEVSQLQENTQNKMKPSSQRGR